MPFDRTLFSLSLNAGELLLLAMNPSTAVRFTCS